MSIQQNQNSQLSSQAQLLQLLQSTYLQNYNDQNQLELNFASQQSWSIYDQLSRNQQYQNPSQDSNIDSQQMFFEEPQPPDSLYTSLNKLKQLYPDNYEGQKNQNKLQTAQKFIQENDQMKTLQMKLHNKYFQYIRKGFTTEEASNKIIKKLIIQRQHWQHAFKGQDTNNLYMKLKNLSGFTQEDTQKTIQIKNEIDQITEQSRSDCISSEESQEISPKQKVDKSYQKKLNQVMQIFQDRIEGQSSSSNCSGDEIVSSKKRKYKEYIRELKKFSLINNQQGTFQVNVYQNKRTQETKPINGKKRNQKLIEGQEEASQMFNNEDMQKRKRLKLPDEQ